MGFLKEMGNLAGETAGGIVGGGVEFVGDLAGSEFIKDVGKSVNILTTKTGQILGEAASGVYDAAGGVLTLDKKQAIQGIQELTNVVVDTVSDLGKGVAAVAVIGIEAAGAIKEGNMDKAAFLGKGLAKIAAVGVLSIGIVDVIDGIDGVEIPVESSDLL